MKLSDLERPFVTASVTDPSIESAVATVKTAEMQGAKAFEVHLPLLDADGDLARLRDATRLPMYASCRRAAFYDLFDTEVSVGNDSDRTSRLLDAVDAGFDGADIELDTFDPQPGPDPLTEAAVLDYAAAADTGPVEVTDDADAVVDQQEFVDDVAARGGETVLSSHAYTHLSPERAVALGEQIEIRGADFAKIVGLDRTMRELLDTLEAHLALTEALSMPYVLMSIGAPSHLGRPLTPMFGSAWVFAQTDYDPGGFHSWPLVENAQAVLSRVDWRTAHDPHR
jgi:antitoxin (DNA-binding transcriptional repressor) of toxin-antitoxin stability system